MSDIRITPMPTDQAQAFWRGEKDAHGMAPERHISSGSGVPCRHCLQEVAAGAPYLVLAYRPFAEKQPYAEVGPVFLHAEPCSAYQKQREIPANVLMGESRLLKAYSRDDRIIYGTGKIVPPEEIANYAEALLARDDTAYVHVRSSQNNCYTFQIDRPS